MNLTELVSYIDTELRIAEIADYSNALNGLQLENHHGKVTKIVAAVDATLPVMRKAVAAGADLLLVHHGMFWTGLQTWTGPVFQKLKLCTDSGLAVYSAHLPLDVHPVLGNNALIAQALGLTPTGGFLEYKGNAVGVTAEQAMSLEELTTRFKTALGGNPVHVCAGGPKTTKKIGISSGGSGSEVAAAAKAGIDTFITGEGPHWSYTLAEELGINLLYGGHYATETFGVKALAAHIKTKFGIPWEFVDHPTGL
ncbi:MAG: Nif3-like dinuclear metal center hexameric protein [Prosthecobacter sp.]|uniref:Nif3-like dinuclear metal center hexameric protein n=1 Tax=Prosthecobacter sp. TaxID=1965333 RepID=UPI0038FDCAE7